MQVCGYVDKTDNQKLIKKIYFHFFFGYVIL